MSTSSTVWVGLSQAKISLIRTQLWAPWNIVRRPLEARFVSLMQVEQAFQCNFVLFSTLFWPLLFFCLQDTDKDLLPLSPFWQIYLKDKGTPCSESNKEASKSKSPRYLEPLGTRVKKPFKEQSRFISAHQEEQVIPRKVMTKTYLPLPFKQVPSVSGKTSPFSVYKKLKPISGPRPQKQVENYDGQQDDVYPTKKDLTKDDILHMATMTMRSIKKFLGQEAGKYLAASDPESRRKRRIKRMLKVCSLPDIVESRKSTSAIFKDYRNFKGTTKLPEIEGPHRSSKTGRRKEAAFVPTSSWNQPSPLQDSFGLRLWNCLLDS